MIEMATNALLHVKYADLCGYIFTFHTETELCGGIWLKSRWFHNFHIQYQDNEYTNDMIMMGWLVWDRQGLRYFPFTLYQTSNPVWLFQND